VGILLWCWLWLWGRWLFSAFLLLRMPSLWLSLEAGGYVAALVTAVFILFILVDVIVEVWPWLR